MRALRSFTVRASLPPALAPLQEVATNMRWSWDERTRDLFRWLDPQQWEESRHDPVRMLGLVSRERLDEVASDPAFMGFLDEVQHDLSRYLKAPRWFQNLPKSSLRAIAYFSPEFGIAEALPQYSGGLGVLAGDHLKAASSLGVPLTGVGLMYRHGYFRQQLNSAGWQEEHYPILDPYAMPLTPVDGKKVTVDLGGRDLVAQIWLAQVGRVKLYLLDADVDDNDDDMRNVTDRLYGGGTEHRIRQEILLGMGGVRALEAIGEPTQVFHTNEGHAGFLGLERIRTLMTTGGLSFSEAIVAVRSGTIFTTHTPVPAGIDRFPRELMERYFSGWAEQCSLSIDQLMELGHFPNEPREAPFNMAVMGLRLAALSNGVSKLHGEVSREMFRELWPGIEKEDAPITSVTNGVHAGTWVSSEMNELLTRHVRPAWDEASAPEWSRIASVRDDELWRVRQQGREALVAFVRERLHRSVVERGGSESDAAWTREVLDPRLLTIGFARRFASYKRATLLLSQPDRLRELLLSPDRPIQLVFAGKAHPADDIGKEMIRQIVQFSRATDVRHRIAFVEDYDIAVARMFVQGSDVWLNTPRRPNEASGTSGEKALLSGALNCSILDGWWAEMFDGTNGWAISSAESYQDLEQRDKAEADSLFDILEGEIIPLFNDRFEGPVPRRWVRRIRSSLQTLGPRVLASRMVKDYVQQMYEPTARRVDVMTADDYDRARALAAWQQRVKAAWSGVAVESVQNELGGLVADLWTTRMVEVEVRLGQLTADDVSVELLHGPVGPTGELAETKPVTLSLVVATPDGIATGTSPGDGAAAAGAPGSGAGGGCAAGGGAGGGGAAADGAGSEEAKRTGTDAATSQAANGAASGHSLYRGMFTCERAGRYGIAVRVVPFHPDLAVPADMGCVTWA
ncbi:MAG: glycogen phosphorylase [Acidimicrobiaceae bacterium]|nr:glycogen phosphorylase [Acidimicrobiaceae bacterium]